MAEEEFTRTVERVCNWWEILKQAYHKQKKGEIFSLTQFCL